MDLVNFCAKYISSIWFGECGAHRNYLITLGHYVTEAPGQLPPDFGFNQRANQVKHNTKSAPNGWTKLLLQLFGAAKQIEARPLTPAMREGGRGVGNRGNGQGKGLRWQRGQWRGAHMQATPLYLHSETTRFVSLMMIK